MTPVKIILSICRGSKSYLGFPVKEKVPNNSVHQETSDKSEQQKLSQSPFPSNLVENQFVRIIYLLVCNGGGIVLVIIVIGVVAVAAVGVIVLLVGVFAFVIVVGVVGVIAVAVVRIVVVGVIVVVVVVSQNLSETTTLLRENSTPHFNRFGA